MTHPTIHASAVLVGAKAALIRGPSGSGKSHLVLRLLQAAQTGLIPFARLVADDRARLEILNGRVLVRPADTLEGLIEIRGSGIRHLPFEPVATVGGVIDLGVQDAVRLPESRDREVILHGVHLPRLAVAPGADPLSPTLALFQSASEWLT